MGLLGAGLMERKEEMKAEFGGAGSQHHARPPLPAIRGSRWQTLLKADTRLGSGCWWEPGRVPACPPVHCPIPGASPHPVACRTQHPRRAGPHPAGRARPPSRHTGVPVGHRLPFPCPPSRLCPAAAKRSSSSGEGARGPGAVAGQTPALVPPCLQGRGGGRAAAPSSTQQHLRKYFIVEVGCAGALYSTNQRQQCGHQQTDMRRRHPKPTLGGQRELGAGAAAPTSPWAWR